MGKFETNQIDLRGDGRIILYQRPDVVMNPKWQCRISVDGSTGYKRFSTKTSDQKEAEKVAIDQYFELQNKVNKGGSLQGVSGTVVLDDSADRIGRFDIKNMVVLTTRRLEERLQQEEGVGPELGSANSSRRAAKAL